VVSTEAKGRRKVEGTEASDQQKLQRRKRLKKERTV
jgi:hypothetical protein